MKSLLAKLKFRNQNKVLILNSPPCFEEDLIELINRTQIDFEPESNCKYTFCIAFAEDEYATENALKYIHQFTDLKGIAWIAIPKQNSDYCHKKLICNEWFRYYPKPVYQVCIHKEWLALQLTVIQ